MGIQKYVYGYDFGTQSCRLSVICTQTGEVIGEAEEYYAHGVISRKFPDSDVMLQLHWYLQIR